ncbi:hypothetical protein J3R30DRAFT_2893918 [Lentinula aciculospora]|uniref:Uncharacterized protein n=1 Tax=Lentinula aciculospora TaxID=153920 RepID=A0A9W9ABG8_9AGAR|nr:hypothetical protein J3R30DRAFT_2893918 [Lentinula aciculospora]
MSRESLHYRINDETTRPQRQVQDTSTNCHMFHVIQHLVLEWLQELLDTMLFYQHFPDITPPYEGYPMPMGFPFPSRIRPALNRSLLPLAEYLQHVPLLSHRVDQIAWAAGEVQASDFDVLLLQCEIFQWVEEVNRNDQLYRSVKAYLVMYGFPALRWTQDGNGQWMSPLVWELRWGERLIDCSPLAFQNDIYISHARNNRTRSFGNR